jgi:hypothetical protein
MNLTIDNPNWLVGWLLVLAAFLSGAIIGLGFHSEDFLGGYNSFRRRLLRLGHIACAALGMLNLLYALGHVNNPWASVGFILGGITMPVVCWLTAWRHGFGRLFFIPVLSLLTAVVFTVSAGHVGGHP